MKKIKALKDNEVRTAAPDAPLRSELHVPQTLEEWLIKWSDILSDSHEVDWSAYKSFGRPISTDWEKRVRQQVEQHFRDVKHDTISCRRLLVEYAECCTKSEVCVQTSGHADKTAAIVVRLDSLFCELTAWRDVIRQTMIVFKGEVAQVLCARFGKGLSVEEVCAKLSISRTTYYNYLNRAMNFAALLAAEKQLLTL